MNIIVADSSSLIILTKCSLMETLSGLFTILIPEAVFNEVVNKDTMQRFPDAKIITGLVSEGKIKVVNVRMSRQRLPISMDKGETEALILAKQTADSILATDDGKAIKACRYLGLSFIVSPKIAVELYRFNAIDLAKAKSSIEKMKLIGRYSPEIIAEAILELEVIKDVKTHNS